MKISPEQLAVAGLLVLALFVLLMMDRCNDRYSHDARCRAVVEHGDTPLVQEICGKGG